MERRVIPSSKSLFQFYGYETNGRKIDDTPDEDATPSQAELWRKTNPHLHPGGGVTNEAPVGVPPALETGCRKCI
jgi:hypothetical protein